MLAYIQAKNVQTVKMCFWQKALGVNGLKISVKHFIFIFRFFHWTIACL